MFVADLHQDRSDNALYLTHKDFFALWTIDDWRNYLWLGSYNQVDYFRLRKWGVFLVWWAICLMPEDMLKPTEETRSILSDHIKYYTYVIDKSDGNLNQIFTSKDIQEGKINVFLHSEWCYFIDESDVDCIYIDTMYEMWIRSFALTWNTDNNLCWWVWSDKWLTKQWFCAIDKIQSNNCIVDLAHISTQGFFDVINHTKKPVMYSHWQMQSINNIPRNCSDDQLVALSKNGWIFGLSPHWGFLWKHDTSLFLDSIKFAVNLMWEDCVALWSDYDGMVRNWMLPWLETVDCLASLPEMLW